MTAAISHASWRRGATLVTCPRSNGHTGAGAPPIAEFYASGVRVAVGTDSLASTPDLNVFAELATMRALAPSVPASRLLDSATRQGARALGFEADYGTLEPGKRARLLAVADSDGARRCGRIPGHRVEPISSWLDDDRRANTMHAGDRCDESSNIPNLHAARLADRVGMVMHYCD